MANGNSPAKCNLSVDGACFNLGQYYVTGQPTDPQGLDDIKQANILSVISFRDPSEQGYDLKESSNLIGMGIGFLNFPILHGMEQDVFNRQATAFAECIMQQQTPLLIHCSTGDRASAMWAVNLYVNEKIELPAAIEYARNELALQNPGIIQLLTAYEPTGQS
ncbi:MAG: hypothetical protein H7Y30_01490 [Pyrinomonadaceae bacterium]|nr:hypothetical protein [Pyrinomonadaceae bacterium]